MSQANKLLTQLMTQPNKLMTQPNKLKNQLMTQPNKLMCQPINKLINQLMA